MYDKIYFSSKPKICANFCGKGELLVFAWDRRNKSNWNLNMEFISKGYMCVPGIREVMEKVKIMKVH